MLDADAVEAVCPKAGFRDVEFIPSGIAVVIDYQLVNQQIVMPDEFRRGQTAVARIAANHYGVESGIIA